MRGTRESHWLVIRRCLAILRRLQRGPASREALISAVLLAEEDEAYGGVDGKVLNKRFDNDLRRIRKHLGVEIAFDRKRGVYNIKDTWTPLLDLPDQDLSTLAWLEEIFDEESPHHDEVQALVDRLRLFLSVERQAEVARQRHLLRLRLTRRDEEPIPEAIWQALARALEWKRLVRLSYRSPQQADEQPRVHLVDIFEPPFFEDGHFYVRGYCRYTTGPKGRYEMRRYVDYRMDRIEEIEVLPERIPPEPPSPPRYEVIYRLSPAVARQGVSRSRWILIEEVKRQEDGNAVVYGSTGDIFRARQFLMRYREHCIVLGGPELRQAMQESVEKMAKMYAGEKEKSGG